MKRIKYAFICLMILISIIPTNNSYALKTMNFENLTIENGLSQSTAETIVQDNKGYIWIGTNDGLNRYNGTDLDIFKCDDKDENSIISNYITSLGKDDNENLWVGTDEGLSKINLSDYSIKNYRYYKNDKDKPYDGILTIYIDTNNKVYAGSKNGLYLYNEKEDNFDKILEIEDDLSDRGIYSINKDKECNLWIGTGNGLNKLDAKTNKVYPCNFGDIKSAEWGRVLTILFDNDNNLWIGTSQQGIKKINLKNNKVEEFYMDSNDDSKLQSNAIRKILQDSSGTIWIATENGLSKYGGDNMFTTYLSKDYDSSSLSSNIVYTIMEDDSGLIWIGTFTGVSIFDSKNKIQIYKNDPTSKNSISSNVVMGVYEDNEGLLWIGTRDKGLNIIDRSKNKISHLYEGNTNYDLSSNAINIIIGEDNIIWVGTRNGINKIDKKNMTIEKYTKEDGLNDNNIKSLFIDSKNNLWIGTPTGLSILNIESNEIYDMTEKLIKEGIVDPYIQEVYEDKEGTFWMGGYTSSGLIKMDLKNDEIEIFNRYQNSDNEEVIVSTVRDIFEDDNNNLWIGTSDGLLKFDKKNNKIQSYTEKDGLANNVVYQILVDDDKNLWMSTNNGISKFDIKNNLFINLRSTDGLQSNEFNGNSAYKCKNGDFVFGGVKGLNIFNPKEVSQHKYEGKVNFDKFQVQGNDYIDINGKVFKYNENFVRIKYFFTDYRKNNNIQYYSKLEGFNSDWILAENNEAIFGNLKPGKYTFRVKCRNNSGEISEENSVSFTIKPPIWRSNLAMLLYIIIILMLIYHNSNKMKRLDKLVNKRTCQLNEEMEKNKVLFNKLIEAERSKNNYFINLSHELRTPLNVINSIEQLIRSLCKSDKELDKIKIEDYMNIMKSNTNRLLNLINNIIDTSKIENGKYKLNKENCDIVYLVEEATLSLKESIESQGINLIFDTDVEEKIINCDKYDIERCVVNLVSNAQKFTPKGGNINVNIIDLKKFVKITVEDTGIGIDKKYHDIIFDRFNQIVDENSENKGGSGLGLTITKHIIDLHGGSIKIESEKNKGTKFEITLPVK